MRKKSDTMLRICLIVGDALALILSFAMAYYIRVKIDPRPWMFTFNFFEFVRTVVLLVPILLIIMAALGLYRKNIFLGRSRLPERWRLLLAAILVVSALIVYDFFRGDDLFPVRVMALTSMVLAFVFLMLERITIRFVMRQIFKKDYGVKRAIIIGNSKNTEYLTDYITSMPESGYKVVGIVAGKKYIPDDLKMHQYSSLRDALAGEREVDVIFQSDEKMTEYVYKLAVEKHLLYYFIPNETALSSHFGEMELIGTTPVVLVSATPLRGGYVVIKRLFDILFSLAMIIITAIPMAVIWLILKFEDYKAPAVYTSERLTQYNRKFKCYKFRSMNPKYSGMTPEEAFKKMGKPQLIEKYRKNGDYLKRDPRVTSFGRFIRRTSLDELPQMFNILKGDISLIGPRALLPGELRDYGDRSLLLTVKSGLTGFAQVSGRRNIPFEERRMLDIYYVRNWSLMLDLQIFFKTIVTVIRRDGAK